MKYQAQLMIRHHELGLPDFYDDDFVDESNHLCDEPRLSFEGPGYV